MKQTEHAIQVAFFEWLAAVHPDVPAFAIPNGGKRNIITAVRLKREGVQPGVPDIFVPVARGGYHGLFIEMKVPKGRTTLQQDYWLDILSNKGYRVRVCRGFDEAVEQFEAYINIK